LLEVENNLTEDAPISDWNNVNLAPLQLVVGWRGSGDSVEVYRVPTNRDVADGLAIGCRAAVDRLTRMEPKFWTVESASEVEEYLYVGRDKLDSGSALIDALNVSTYDVLSAEELPSKSLLFYAMVTGTGDRRLIFLRKQSPRRAADKRIVTFFSNRLERILQPVFIFDEGVDLVFDSGMNISILTLGVFNLLFKSTPEMLQRIPAQVQEIAARLPMSSASIEFLGARAQTDTRMRRRLESIISRGHLVNVTVDVLRAEIVRQGLSPEEFIKDGELDVAQVDVPDILKVLNEDLFTGGLSGEHFEVARKSPRSN
jgi:hypothetical protein